ncbi:MAG: hypothetical protein CHACPFDD_00112 [Phycisphaerae bacterium]|nr:hypothetical protein [Phycisphaerae bacterium]
MPRIVIGALSLALLLSAAASAAELTPGNILVSVTRSTDDYTIREYTPAGDLVQQWSIPPVGDPPFLRDLTVSSDGIISAYNGTFDPFLTRLNPSTGAMNHRTFAGWSTVSGVGYGGVAAWSHYVFATDMDTFGDAPRGIVRFDVASNTAQRFADNADFRQIELGLDGLLYGQTGIRSIAVYEPSTLALVRTVNLPFEANDVRGIAVNAAGDIFTNSLDAVLRRFSPTGTLLDSIPTGSVQTQDIDLLPDGRIIAGHCNEGRVFLTDESLDSITSFAIPNVHVTYVAWTPEPTTFAMLAFAASMLRSRRRLFPRRRATGRTPRD